MKRLFMIFHMLIIILLIRTVIWGPDSVYAKDGGTRITHLMRKAPYLLYPGTNTEMQVIWQLDSTSTCLLEWGSDSNYTLGSIVTNEYGTDHQHTYVIGNLTPGTKYYYRVTAGQEQYTGSFITAPPNGSTHTRFLLYGDSRSNPPVHDQVVSAILPTFSEGYQTLILNTGDLVKNGNNEAQWDSMLFNPNYPHLRQLLANVPYVANMGNHDAYATGYRFRKYLPYPYVERSNWAFEYGQALFIILDQYIDYSPGSTQLTWVESQLASSTKPWKFISLHHPGWSAGAHENDSTVQAYIQPLCEQYGVAMVFCGHNHYYARANVNGVRHITTGGGGAELYTPNPAMPYVVTTTKAWHFCKIAIDGNTLTLTAIKLDGTVIDSFSMQAPVVSLPGNSNDPFPTKFRLNPAYPNPFNSRTTINYYLPKTLDVVLKIYNIFGQEVRTMVQEQQKAGEKSVVWDGCDNDGQPVSSGVYIYRIEAIDPLSEGGKIFSHSRTMVLLK